MTIRKLKPHAEMAFVPMNDGRRCVRWKPYFRVLSARHTARDARNDVAKNYPGGWPALKERGWRIVKVRIEVIR